MTAINHIEELPRDSEVTEIMVDAPDSVWVVRQGRIEPVGVKFLDEGHVQRTIEHLVDPDDCHATTEAGNSTPAACFARGHRSTVAASVLYAMTPMGIGNSISVNAIMMFPLTRPISLFAKAAR